MKPIDTFYFLKNNRIQPDFGALSLCYQPIIGWQATSLYQLLHTWFDDGAQPHQWGQLLNQLNVGMPVLEQALAHLTAMDLAVLYRKDDLYYIELKGPLAQQDFINHNIYRALLEKRIGEEAVTQLRLHRPLAAEDISTSFAQVFDQMGRVQPATKHAQDFDLDHFKQQMARDRLRFKAEQDDVIALYRMAEQHRLTWYQTYLLARETAVGQVISTQRMVQKLRPTQQTSSQVDFSKAEQTIIAEAKQKPALTFLMEIKQARKAAVTRQDQEFLQELGQLGLLDEVINIIVVWTFRRVDSANLNEKYARKVANEFLYRQITTAEAAMAHLKSSQTNQAKTPSSTQRTQSQPNIPVWSNPDYKDETTEAELAELAALREEIMKNLAQGGEANGSHSESS